MTEYIPSSVVSFVMCVLVKLTDILRQSWELIYVLACVFAAGHTEAKLKIKALKELIAEIVPLYHTEIVDGCVSNSELHSARKAKKWTNLPGRHTV